jgi:Protein of unknown function (DUF4244)
MTVVPVTPLPRSRRLRRLESQAGAVSAEYAVATVAACGFAGILFKIISSPQVLELLVNLFTKALSWLF